MNKLVQAIIVLAAVASALPEDRFVEDAPLPQTALVGMLQDWHATLDKPDQHLAQQCYALAAQALPSNNRHKLPLKTALKEFLKAHPQCTRTTTKLQNEVLKSKLAVPASTTLSMTLMGKAGRRRRGRRRRRRRRQTADQVLTSSKQASRDAVPLGMTLTGKSGRRRRRRSRRRRRRQTIPADQVLEGVPTSTQNALSTMLMERSARDVTTQPLSTTLAAKSGRRRRRRSRRRRRRAELDLEESRLSREDMMAMLLKRSTHGRDRDQDREKVTVPVRSTLMAKSWGWNSNRRRRYSSRSYSSYRRRGNYSVGGRRRRGMIDSGSSMSYRRRSSYSSGRRRYRL